MTDAEIRQHMKANSEAWHKASPAEREKLHAENVMFNSHLHNSGTYNERSGAWDGSSSKVYEPSGSYYDHRASRQDKEAINSIKSQYDKYKKQAMSDGVISADEKAALDKIHSQAEGVRAQYGYSGGVDGSGYNPLDGQQGGYYKQPYKSGIDSATSQNDYINSLYDAQKRLALEKLKAAYDQNTISLDAAAAKIPEVYQSARNQTAATAEQNKANFNERAAASGLNSGAGGQAALAMGNQLTGNLSSISTQEANAKTDLETERLKLSTQYQNAIAEAEATGDLARAQALYQEAIRVDNSLVQQSQLQADENYRYWAAQNQVQQQQLAMQRKQAETLAAYGDFSGFGELGYTPDQISNMQTAWAVKNPLIAASRGINVGGFTGGYTGGGRARGYSSGKSSSYTSTNNWNPPSKNYTADTTPTISQQYKKSSAYGQVRYDASMNRTSNGAVNTIEKAVKSGKVTETEGEKILAELGF